LENEASAKDQFLKVLNHQLYEITRAVNLDQVVDIADSILEKIEKGCYEEIAC
jgi:pantothenate kinase